MSFDENNEIVKSFQKKLEDKPGRAFDKKFWKRYKSELKRGNGFNWKYAAAPLLVMLMLIVYTQKSANLNRSINTEELYRYYDSVLAIGIDLEKETLLAEADDDFLD